MMTDATIEGRIEFTWTENERGWVLYAGQVGVAHLWQLPSLEERGDWWYVWDSSTAVTNGYIEGLDAAKKEVLDAWVDYFGRMLSCN